VIYFDLELADGMTWSLERLWIVEAMHGEARQAACLLGAASVMRETLGRPLERWDREDLERAVAAVRVALGETVFEDAWEAGHALSLEQTVAYALAANG
jgi:hypothetical protein